MRRSKGYYRLTPDMKLVVRLAEGTKGQDIINEAKKVLRDVSSCALAQA